MKKIKSIALSLLFILLISYLQISCSRPGTTEFKKGTESLNQDHYKSTSKTKGALECFQNAYKLDNSWGKEIASELRDYGTKLVIRGDILNLIHLDALTVYSDAINFDVSQKEEILTDLQSCYFKNPKSSILYLVETLYNSSDKKIIKKYLKNNSDNRIKYIKEHDIRGTYIIYNISFALCKHSPRFKEGLIQEITENSHDYLDNHDLLGYIRIARYILKESDNKRIYDSFLKDIRSYIYLTSESGDYKESIDQFNTYISNIDNDLEEDDEKLLNIVFYNALTDYNVSASEAYDIFRAVMQMSWFKNVKFYFINDCKKQLNLKKNSYLRRKLDRPEQVLFYCDTSRLGMVHKGFLLTDKSIIWKNICGETNKIYYGELTNIRLIFKRGFSFTGWELELNDSSGYDVRLSKIPEKYFTPFLSAVIYFINYNNRNVDSRSQLSLSIGERAQKVLNGSFWERNKEIVIGVGAMVAIATGCYIITTNPQLLESMFVFGQNLSNRIPSRKKILANIAKSANKLRRMPKIRLTNGKVSMIKNDLPEAIRKYTGKSATKGYIEFFSRISPKRTKQILSNSKTKTQISQFIRNASPGKHEWFMVKNFTDFLTNPKWGKDKTKAIVALDKIRNYTTDVKFKTGGGHGSTDSGAFHNMLSKVISQSKNYKDMIKNVDQFAKKKKKKKSYKKFISVLGEV